MVKKKLITKKVDKQEMRKVMTLVEKSRETWRWLHLVPLVLAIQTSNPLSASMNARDSSGEFNSQVIPSYDCLYFSLPLV